MVEGRRVSEQLAMFAVHVVERKMLSVNSVMSFQTSIGQWQ
jgi:hypothetical protein